MSATLASPTEGRRESPRVSIVSEPLTYQAKLVRDHGGLRAISTRGNYSYVRDFILAETRGDGPALNRLARHAEEMRTIATERERIFAPDVGYEFEQRAVSWASGTGGYFAPPLWIVEHFATVPTPERVLSRLAPNFDLPLGAQSVNLPAFSTGPDVDVTAVDSATPSATAVDTPISSAVTTIAGNFDVPIQMLEQSPLGAHLDWVAFTNMEARYGYKLERQLFVGSGASTPQGSGNNQLLGILNNTAIPAANIVTYTDATPTVAKMIQTSGQGGPIPQAVAAIGNNRKAPPEYWMLTTSRGAWIASGELAFPLALENMEGPGHFGLIAYEAWPNDAIPTTLGTAGNQDIVLACRPSDWLILESERRTSINRDVLSGTLEVRLQMRRYVAALLRFPSSVAYVTGTGMAVPTNF